MCIGILDGSNCVQDNIAHVDYDIESQRMGGASINNVHLYIDDLEFHNLSGSKQLWSGGIEHFILKDNDGKIIEFSKNTDGSISNFKK